MQNLIVNEIFESIQGEGGRAGELSIFIRLSKCNLSCNFCDTEFESGKVMNLEEIERYISQFSAKWIIWTGGEPMLQLNKDIVSYFRRLGYKQAIETNGTKPIDFNLDYVVVSPKVSVRKLKENFKRVNEIRVPVRFGQKIPRIEDLVEADFYFLSPIFDGLKLIKKNLDYCLNKMKEEPRWRLSVQIHKLLGVR